MVGGSRGIDEKRDSDQKGGRTVNTEEKQTEEESHSIP